MATFTPTTIETAAAAYSTQAGTYVKVGRFLPLAVYICWSAHGGAVKKAR